MPPSKLQKVSSVLACLCTIACAAAASAKPIAHVRTIQRVDWTSAGVGGVGGGSGTISLTGVTGAVERAFLYWHGIDRQVFGDSIYDNNTVLINGVAVNGVELGDATTNCWGPGSSRAFRADVTSQVAGDGSYAISDLSSKPGHNANGASLVVIFDDGDSSNDRDLVFFEGNDSNNTEGFPGEDNGWNGSLSGINYQGGVVSAELHVADGQSFPDNSLTFTGAAPLTIPDATGRYDGTTVPNAGTSRSGGDTLWDIHEFDLTAAFADPGETTLSMTGQLFNNDCIGLILLLVDLEPGTAPPAPGNLDGIPITPAPAASATGILGLALVLLGIASLRLRPGAGIYAAVRSEQNEIS